MIKLGPTQNPVQTDLAAGAAGHVVHALIQILADPVLCQERLTELREAEASAQAAQDACRAERVALEAQTVDFVSAREEAGKAEAQLNLRRTEIADLEQNQATEFEQRVRELDQLQAELTRKDEVLREEAAGSSVALQERLDDLAHRGAALEERETAAARLSAQATTLLEEAEQMKAEYDRASAALAEIVTRRTD